jgi:ribose 5-phosphate isomerase RpiB
MVGCGTAAAEDGEKRGIVTCFYGSGVSIRAERKVLAVRGK